MKKDNIRRRREWHMAGVTGEGRIDVEKWH